MNPDQSKLSIKCLISGKSNVQQKIIDQRLNVRQFLITVIITAIIS